MPIFFKNSSIKNTKYNLPRPYYYPGPIWWLTAVKQSLCFSCSPQSGWPGQGTEQRKLYRKMKININWTKKQKMYSKAYMISFGWKADSSTENVVALSWIPNEKRFQKITIIYLWYLKVETILFLCFKPIYKPVDYPATLVLSLFIHGPLLTNFGTVHLRAVR